MAIAGRVKYTPPLEYERVRRVVSQPFSFQVE